MGLKFTGYEEGRGEFVGCSNCSCYVTCSKELSSTAFTGSTGPASLYKRVWNVSHGELVKRELTTGVHVVRDVFCVHCKKRLGWMYEYTKETSQQYKEGRFILECALVKIVSQAIIDPLGEEDLTIQTPIEIRRPNPINR